MVGPDQPHLCGAGTTSAGAGRPQGSRRLSCSRARRSQTCPRGNEKLGKQLPALHLCSEPSHGSSTSTLTHGREGRFQQLWSPLPRQLQLLASRPKTLWETFPRLSLPRLLCVRRRLQPASSRGQCPAFPGRRGRLEVQTVDIKPCCLGKSKLVPPSILCSTAHGAQRLRLQLFRCPAGGWCGESPCRWCLEHGNIQKKKTTSASI